MRRALVLLVLAVGCDEGSEPPAPTCVDWLSCYDTCAHDFEQTTRELPGVEELEICQDVCQERTGYAITSGSILALSLNQGGILQGANAGECSGADRFRVVLELRALCHKDALDE